MERVARRKLVRYALLCCRWCTEFSRGRASFDGAIFSGSTVRFVGAQFTAAGSASIERFSLVA